MGWTRYVAVGDSFTEGTGDPGPQGRNRGWADRVAAELGGAEPQLRYANLAVRGKKLASIVAEQVPEAVGLEPDLVSFAGGINDAMRPRWDLAAMAAALESGVSALAGTGAEVVIVTFGRPSNRSKVLGTIERRLAAYREATFAVAGRYGATVVDFWDETVFDDPRFWSEDRLHLNTLGHQRVAMAVLEAMGRPGAEPWRDPLPPAQPVSRASRIGRDVSWTRQHFAPWIGRRVVGRSTGDGMAPKRPLLEPVDATS